MISRDPDRWLKYKIAQKLLSINFQVYFIIYAA